MLEEWTYLPITFYETADHDLLGQIAFTFKYLMSATCIYSAVYGALPMLWNDS